MNTDDSPILIRRFETKAQLLDAFEQRLREDMKTGPGTALSGGSTPLAVYHNIARRPEHTPIGFKLMIVDERNVPDDDPASNFGAMRPMLEALPLGDNDILRPRPLPGPESALKFEQDLDAWIDAGGRLRTCWLGLGDDGHTASLFTADDVDACEGRRAIYVKKPEPPHRVSITPTVMQLADEIIIVAAGAAKRQAIQTLQHTPERIAAGLVSQQLPRIQLWADSEALGAE